MRITFLTSPTSFLLGPLVALPPPSPPDLVTQTIFAAEEARLARPSVRAARARYQRFLAFLSREQATVSFHSVASFVTTFMLANSGRTTSLSALVGQLRSQAREQGHIFLSAPAETRLAHLIAQYRLTDSAQVRRMAPLRTALVLQIITRWDLHQPAQLTQACLLLLAVQALLRTGEVTIGLRVTHFVWLTSRRSVRIHIPALPGASKTATTGAGVFIEVADNAAPISAYKLLSRLFVLRSLRSHPNSFVFCMVRQGTLYPAIRSSPRAFRTLIKAGVRSLGLNPTLYSGHSARAGGATDLYAAGVPYYVVKTYGRWRSDAALIYYRCDSSIAQAAAVAFSGPFL
jgi:Phage integrase family